MLRSRGCEVFGVRRSSASVPDGVTAITKDLCADKLDDLPENLDAVVWSVAPARDEAGYRRAYVDGPDRLLRHLERRGDPLKRAVLVSSTSVWHRVDAAEIDEQTPPNPADFRGATVLDGERAFADRAASTVALRFAGIYGPGRTGLLDKIAASAAAPPLDAVYGNRIWCDDGARAVVHALSLDDPDPAYIVADDEPADLRDVYAWIAQQLNVALPRPAASFTSRGGNKRCSNARLRESGLRLEVPDYRAGYSRLMTGR